MTLLAGLPKIDLMFKRKLRTVRRLLREGGIAAVYPRIVDNLTEKTVVLNGCTFGSRGISVDVLRNDLLDGRFEKFERESVQEFVSPQLPVIELGGCLGVIGCITNRLLAHPREHVVVEANPNVIPLMKANRKRNHCRFQILHRAIAYGQKTIRYVPAANFAGNSLRETNGGPTVAVKTTTLADIVAKNRFKRFSLICDIEGHECELVEQESDILRMADVIILETHARMIGEERNQSMLQRLEELGFRVVKSEATVIVLKNQSTETLELAS